MTAVEHILAYEDICRIEHFVMVVSGRYIVIHIKLLQVLTVLEGTIVYDHLECSVCIFTARCAILEHHLFNMLVATQGSSVNGDGLVVVGSTYIVVDTHFAIFLSKFFVVYSNHLHIPGLIAIGCR